MKFFLFVLVCLASLDVQAKRSSFDSGWNFIQEDISGGELANFDDSSWGSLDVPHDWSIEGEYSKDHPMGDRCGYLPAGVGWYRKTIQVPAEWKGKHVEIAFDGVFMNSTVWANGRKLGFRPYGWISFAYDITEEANNADTITFAVRVDNTLQPSARWYTGSGIYGHTWIDVKDPLHIKTEGVFVRTKEDTVSIDTEIVNTTQSTQSIIIRSIILDKSGNAVKSIESPLEITPGEELTAAQECTVSNPLRWSLDTPNLYTLRSEIIRGKEIIESQSIKFGVRDIRLDEETGLWLNGENVKMRGVCNHQDAGALGAAVPDKILRFRIQQLKDMGCNAIRTAHNPQTPQFYGYCNEIGMLVMDEIFDGWKRKAGNDYGSQAFGEWWEQDLTDWIQRDRNHPSVVIWSVGNETRGSVAESIVELCHKLDPTRKVTSGHSGTEHMDIHGYNGASEKEDFFDKHKSLMIGTENTHTWQVRGYYRTKTWYRDGYPNQRQKPFEIPDLTKDEVFSHDWTDAGRGSKQIFNSSYDNATVRSTSRHNIQQLRDIPYFAGTFRWTGHDYIGEAGYVHGGWPFKAFMGGAIDLANFEKDLYYLYQSQWTEKPMVHILPHWTHPKMKPETDIPVWVYSNGEKVELFFNDTSLGEKAPGTEWNEMQCQWMVPWQPGTLRAVAYKNGKVVAEKEVRTADAPSKIALSVDGTPLAESGKDIVQVRVTTTDAQGTMYPYGENRTFFHLLGPAGIRALGNGSPIDVEKHFGVNNRIAFYGLTRAFIESTREAGDIAILAGSIVGEKRLITSNQVSIDTQVLALRGTAPVIDVDIFYTTDGSEPTEASTRYTQPFEIALGTTVKALVMANGQPVFTMTERFTADEGFAWRGQAETEGGGGDQAEDSTFKGATVAKSGSGYKGKGYLDFGKSSGFVEWYQENDGDAGMSTIVIRYSYNNSKDIGRHMKLVVNGQTVEEELLFPNCADWGRDWKTVAVEISIKRGANTIRLQTIGKGGPYIDQLIVQ